MYQSTAILERASMKFALAAKIGSANGCFYCDARHRPSASPGAVVVKLNDYDCGQMFEVLPDGQSAKCLNDGSGGEWIRRFSSHQEELFGEVPLVPRPWLPPFSMRDAFIVDELAVWFVERGLSTDSYHWKPDDCIEVARTLWTKHIPITPSELSEVFCVHGLPTECQSEFESLVRFATQTLLSQKPRMLHKKKRMNGFEGILDQPSSWVDYYVRPFLA